MSRRPVPRGTTAGDYIASAPTRLAEADAREAEYVTRTTLGNVPEEAGGPVEKLQRLSCSHSGTCEAPPPPAPHPVRRPRRQECCSSSTCSKHHQTHRSVGSAKPEYTTVKSPSLPQAPSPPQTCCNVEGADDVLSQHAKGCRSSGWTSTVVHEPHELTDTPFLSSPFCSTMKSTNVARRGSGRHR